MQIGINFLSASY